MAKEKKEYVNYTSPVGVVKWASIMTPQTEIKSEGVTKPVDPNYNITLLYEQNNLDVVELMKSISDLHTAAYTAAQKASKKKLVDQGLGNCFANDLTKDGEPTGKIAFKFKHKASGVRMDKSVWTFKPAVFDAYGTPIPAGTVVYGGSMAQVSFGVKHNAMQTGAFYTSLSLNAVVVTVLKSEIERSAESFGFKLAKREEADNQDAFGEQIPAGEAADVPADSTDF